MRLLLDANALIWWLQDDRARLGIVRAAIMDPTNVIYVSVVSAWEIAIKVGLGRLPLRPDVAEWFPRELERNGFELLQVALEHVLAVERLPRHHRDPFDRLLVTQCLAERLTIVTSDHAFEPYGIPLMPCGVAS